MTNPASLLLDGTETVDLERDGRRQRFPLPSVARYALDQTLRVAKVALADADTGGGVLSWQNPEDVPIAIVRAALDVTTPATSAATVDVGIHATSPTTANDTLLDGLDVHTAAGLFDNYTSPGTNGLTGRRLGVGGYVTASKASGACAGLVGYAYITYHRL